MSAAGPEVRSFQLHWLTAFTEDLSPLWQVDSEQHPDPSPPDLLTFPCFPVSQFSRSVMSDSLRPHGMQHAKLPCPSPTYRACSNSCPLSQWCQSSVESLLSSLIALQVQATVWGVLLCIGMHRLPMIALLPCKNISGEETLTGLTTCLKCRGEKSTTNITYTSRVESLEVVSVNNTLSLMSL